MSQLSWNSSSFFVCSLCWLCYEELVFFLGEVCLTTTRMVGDLCTALEGKIVSYCDTILQVCCIGAIGKTS